MRDLSLYFVGIIINLYPFFLAVGIILDIRPEICLSHRFFIRIKGIFLFKCLLGTLFTLFTTAVLTLATAAGMLVFICHIAVLTR